MRALPPQPCWADAAEQLLRGRMVEPVASSLITEDHHVIDDRWKWGTLSDPYQKTANSGSTRIGEHELRIDADFRG